LSTTTADGKNILACREECSPAKKFLPQEKSESFLRRTMNNLKNFTSKAPQATNEQADGVFH
jgi:hypothetical protein